MMQDSIPPSVLAWLGERLWWDGRVRMMAQAAVLGGGPLKMADEPVAVEHSRPAEHV
jgi:hypothetical protein